MPPPAPESVAPTSRLISPAAPLVAAPVPTSTLPAAALEAVPELGYLPSDKTGPKGEVCLRGPCMFAGYYKQPEMTAETVDKDGFFHTGVTKRPTWTQVCQGLPAFLAPDCLGWQHAVAPSKASKKHRWQKR